MKNLVLAFCAIFAFATAAVAQAPAAAPAAKVKDMKGHGKDHGKEMGEKGKAQGEKAQGQAGEKGKGQMGGNLGLTPEQEAAFKTVNKAHQEAVKTVQMDKALAADAKKAKVDALKSKYEADVKGVMNADQYAKWMAIRAKRDDKKEEMGDHKMEDHKDKAAKMEGKATKGKAKSDKAAQPQGAAKSN
jgi:hypothetical protein